MSKKSLKSLSEQLDDDVIVEIESIKHTEMYLRLPDIKISDNGSVKSLEVAAYSSTSNDKILLHRLFGKTKMQSNSANKKN